MNQLLKNILITAGLATCTAVAAEAPSSDQLYRVSTVRAAPGSFEALLDWAGERNRRDFLVARHSQGDHWDIMLIIPIERLSLDDPLDEVDELIAFQEDIFASGPPARELRDAYAENGLLHIEMFAALPGNKARLLNQRYRENAYLEATGQVTNFVFTGHAGSDVDVFTIGFHEDFAAFGASAPEDPDAAEAAAKAAGFKDRADLSFYLRSLIASHQDTLATTMD